jgi:hypothetical protein
VRGRVAVPRLPRAPPRAADHRRARDRQCGGEPGRREVEQVVEAGRGPAEPAVARRAVADHRVKRVHRAVAEQTGHAGDRTPQQRRDHGVGRVLGDRLDRGPREAVGVEVARVAAAQLRQPVAGRRQLTGVQLTADGGALHGQRATAEHHPRRRGRRQRLQHRAAAAEPLHRHAERDHPAAQHGGVDHARQLVVAVQHPLDPLGDLPEPGHRMPPARVTQRTVRGDPEQQPDRARNADQAPHPHLVRTPR